MMKVSLVNELLEGFQLNLLLELLELFFNFHFESVFCVEFSVCGSDFSKIFYFSSSLTSLC